MEGVSYDRADRRGGWSTDDALRLHGAHRLSSVRLAVLLVDDLPVAEDLVQVAFAGFLSRSRALQDPDKALAYLRASVVSQARSVLRGHRTPIGHSPALAQDHREVLAAVRQLPNRQREVLVLRYWSDLSEVQIADALGVTGRTVESTAGRALSALESPTPGTATGSRIDDRVREAFRARAGLVEGEDLSQLELPEPARRSRRMLLLALAAAACAAVVVVPFVFDPPVDDEPDGERLPEGAVRMDVNGDSRQDVVNVDFDPAARTYLLTVEVSGGPDLTYQGLALTRPTLIGAVDLDADYSAEIAVNVGDATTTLPEFFRYVDGNLRRLSPPATTEMVNGWDMTSRLNQFTLEEGRLYTWRDDPRSVQEPQVTDFWQWQVVDEDRIEPGPRQERCITSDSDLPVDCPVLFPVGSRDQQTTADLDSDGAPDDVRLDFSAASDDVVISKFTVSAVLATGDTVYAEGPGGWRPGSLEPISIGAGRQQVLVSREGGESDIPSVFGLVDGVLRVAVLLGDQPLATGFDGTGRYTRYWVEGGDLFSYRTLRPSGAPGGAPGDSFGVEMWSWTVEALGDELVLQPTELGTRCVDASVDELPAPC
ncbi:MAG: hypothetical protein H0V42_04625 [Nocardioidaceae bacterium]|nr:hypothetical protein [Nocardioidaceae bacterium]